VIRKVCLVGSTTFPLDAAVGAEIVDTMLAFGDDVAFLTRGSKGFDQFVMTVAPLVGRTCLAYPSEGGADNFVRDIELVRDADEILAFFDPATLHREDTGTGHVVETALNQKKPVRAFTTVNGSLVYVGAEP
jgi:hypothetical protein